MHYLLLLIYRLITRGIYLLKEKRFVYFEFPVILIQWRSSLLIQSLGSHLNLMRRSHELRSAPCVLQFQKAEPKLWTVDKKLYCRKEKGERGQGLA